MENIAHIKINQPGVKLMAPTIRITKTTKEIDQSDFSLFSEDIFDIKNENIDFKLPFVSDLSLNYNKGYISFILINERYRYYATVKKDDVYLIPWGVFYEDIARDLPVIKLGKFSDWEKKLDMQIRMIGYFLIKDKTGKYVMADFKTASKNTMAEYERYIKTLSHLRVNERYEVESQMFIKGKLEGDLNVHYLSFSDIVSDLRNIPDNERKVTAAMIERYEAQYIEDEKEKYRNAISMDEAEKFFGRKVIIKLDRDSNNGFEYKVEATPKVSNASIPNEETKEDINSIVKEISDFGVPVRVAEALVRKHGQEAINLAKEANYQTKNILKLF